MFTIRFLYYNILIGYAVDKDSEKSKGHEQRREKEIYNDVLENFPKFSDDKVYQLLTTSYSDKNLGTKIKRDIWSWTNILEYDEKKIQDLTKGEKIYVFGENEPFSDDTVEFSQRSSVSGSSIFNCSNGNAVNVHSTQMLDAALNMKSFSGEDLMYLFDNYVLGSGSIDNQEKSFNTLEYRDKVFSSPKLDYATLYFLDEAKGNQKQGDSIEGFEETIIGIKEEEFISKNVAKKAFNKLLSENKNKILVENINSLSRTQEILCHVEEKDIEKLLNIDKKNNAIKPPEEELMCDRLKGFIKSTEKKRRINAGTFEEKEYFRKKNISSRSL
jgi:hypothetical protein